MSIDLDYTYGFYQVGNTAYLNKTEALHHATITNQDVRWDFHDAIYSSVDWSKKPSGQLTDLYKQRAQQIRDTYDYVVVHFSGGSDSWTVLNTFLSNGIHVDEIYTRWARKDREYTKANNTDLREYNISSEYEYAVEPILKEIAKKYPKTKIYLDDYSEVYQQDLTEDKFLNSNHFVALGTFHRYTRKSPHEIEAHNNGKSVGIVYGMDKIQCCVEDGNFYAYFSDRLAGSDLDPTRSIELFFWTPKFPLIPILQSHLLKEYYDATTHAEAIKNGKNNYISVCYPGYNINTFQTGKAFGSGISASELWIFKYNPRYIDSWKWLLSQYQETIDSKYCKYWDGAKKLQVGYNFIHSKKYFVGTTLVKRNHDYLH